MSIPMIASPSPCAQRHEVLHGGVVADVLVAVGDHGPAAVPPASSDDVDFLGEERVGGAHHGADVEVVLPVLDGDVEVVPLGVQVRDDRLVLPVAVLVHHVAPVAVRQQVRVPVVARRASSPSQGPTPTSAFGSGVFRLKLGLAVRARVSRAFESPLNTRLGSGTQTSRRRTAMAEADTGTKESCGAVYRSGQEIECWLTDMDGVLVHENQPVPGAAELIQRWVDTSKRFLVLTNNSIFTPARPRRPAAGLRPGNPGGEHLDLGPGHRPVPEGPGAGLRVRQPRLHDRRGGTHDGAARGRLHPHRPEPRLRGARRDPHATPSRPSPWPSA